MEREDYLSQISLLKDAFDQVNASSHLLRQALEFAEQRNASLESIICDLIKEVGSLRAEVSKLGDYNKRHNKMSFGKKSLSSSTRADVRKSREEEKQDCATKEFLHKA